MHTHSPSGGVGVEKRKLSLGQLYTIRHPGKGNLRSLLKPPAIRAAPSRKEKNRNHCKDWSLKKESWLQEEEEATRRKNSRVN